MGILIWEDSMKYNEVKNKYKYKSYTHFDYKSHAKSHHDYIIDPSNISTHSFYPFIRYTNRVTKYNKNHGRTPKEHRIVKDREIYICSHIDRYIYQYYSVILNENYNNYLNEKKLSMVSTAYRTDKPGKTNIHFAKEVFEYISKSEDSYIIVGDFKTFFDSLGHKNLKERLKTVLGENNISDDLYSVFRSVTKFSYIDFEDIQSYYRNVLQYSNNAFKKLDIFFENDFNKRKNNIMKSNRSDNSWKNFGIPQGTPISGILSNIYMIEFDEKMCELAKKFNGMYRRYSDDFILIVESDSCLSVETLIDDVAKFVLEDSHITIQKEKYEKYHYKENRIYQITGETREKSQLNYLGFSFDGKSVKIRMRTVSKYYIKAYDYIDKQVFIENRQVNNGKIKRRSKRKIFLKFTSDGSNPTARDKWGNFITYVIRCKKVMKSESFTFDDQKLLKNHRNNMIKRMSNRTKL